MSVYENTNGMPMSDGRNLHMQTARGEVANRIVVVGTSSRAKVIASLFDSDPAPQTITSTRGFLTITGYYRGVHVSVVAIGMGPSMMDFFVREARAVVEGPMAVIRFGTCGGIVETASEGSIVVASAGSSFVARNYDYFPEQDIRDGQSEPYHLHKVAPSNTELSSHLVSEMESEVGADRVHKGLNVTADSFYSSQNRIDQNFDDCNHDILSRVVEKFPSAMTMEMETYLLLHLAQCCKVPIKASAAAIVVANRQTARVIDEETFNNLETQGGRAVLNALTKLNV